MSTTIVLEDWVIQAIYLIIAFVVGYFVGDWRHV
jgi:hypothetical protein